MDIWTRLQSERWLFLHVKFDFNHLSGFSVCTKLANVLARIFFFFCVFATQIETFLLTLALRSLEVWNEGEMVKKVGGYSHVEGLMRGGRYWPKGAFSAIQFLCSLQSMQKFEGHGPRLGAREAVDVPNMGTASPSFLFVRSKAQGPH